MFLIFERFWCWKHFAFFTRFNSRRKHDKPDKISWSSDVWVLKHSGGRGLKKLFFFYCFELKYSLKDNALRKRGYRSMNITNALLLVFEYLQSGCTFSTLAENYGISEALAKLEASFVFILWWGELYFYFLFFLPSLGSVWTLRPRFYLS